MDLPERVCIGCGQTDNHPRHVVIVQDGSEVPWHLDCHALIGCESCQYVTQGAEGKTGDQLRDHLTSGKA